MRFFLTTIIYRLKLSLTKALFTAMLLFVVSLAFVTLAFAERQGLMMNVGLFCPDTAYAGDLASAFELYAADTAAVTRYAELEPMLKDVAGGRLECAYALPGEYVKDARIDLYVTPETVGASVSNMLMASTYMRGMAADLGFKVLKNYLPDDRQEIMAAVAEKNKSYLSRGAFMEIEYTAQKGGAAANTPNLYYVLNGTAALFSALITMLLCLGLVREQGTAISQRLGIIGGQAAYFLGNVSALFLLNLVLFTSAGLATAFVLDVRLRLVPALAYALFVSVFGVCLSRIIKSESLFLGITILGFLSAAVLGGVFADIGGLIPVLDWVKYLFPTYYFIEGLRGSPAYALLAAAAVIGVVLAVRRVRDM